MKKLFKTTAITLALSMVLTTVPTIIYPEQTAITVEAASSVKYKIEDGVLTIYGKGNMPKNMTFKNNLNIKKVVIKKGVTSITKSAFRNCSNLEKVKIAKTVKNIGKYSFEGTGIKTITIPKSVNKIGYMALSNCKNLETIKMPGDFTFTGTPHDNYERLMDTVETVTFTTPLNIKVIRLTTCYNLIVSEEDPNYTSIDGVIYSKDGTELVRVPSRREELTLVDSCTTFCINSVLYSVNTAEDETYTKCSLKKLVLPETVTKVDDRSYDCNFTASVNCLPLREIIVKNPTLDSSSIANLFYLVKDMSIGISDEREDLNLIPLDIIKLKDGIITKDGDYVIAYGNALITYNGNEDNIVIPDYITSIENYAFYFCRPENYMDEIDYSKLNATSITLPKNLESIGDYAFTSAKITNPIVLPESLKRIGRSAFSWCFTNGITLPTNIEYIGDYAFCWFRGFTDTVTFNADIKLGKYVFASSDINSIVLPDSTKKIPEGMFYQSELTTINSLPKLKTIKKNAFGISNVNVQSILDCKSLKTIGEEAFELTDFSSITIPSNVKRIDANAFSPKRINTNCRIIIEGSAKYFDPHAFEHNLNTVFVYKGTTKYSFGIVDIDSYRKEKSKKTKVTLNVNKVKNIDGYEVEIYTDSNYTKNKKTYSFKANKKGKTIKTVLYKTGKNNIYVKVRTYKTIDGKKVYGKWIKIKSQI